MSCPLISPSSHAIREGVFFDLQYVVYTITSYSYSVQVVNIQ